MIMTKTDVNLDAVFYSGSTARTSYLNVYVHSEANIGFCTEIDAFFVIHYVTVVFIHTFTQASLKPFCTWYLNV